MPDDLPRAAGKGPLFIKPATWQKLVDFILNIATIFDPRDFEVSSRGKRQIIRIRWPKPSNDRAAGGETCAFGSITVIDGDKAITGGSINCGPVNFAVDNYTIDATGTSDNLVFIRLDGITANLDDDGVLILPGIAACSGTPTWELITFGSGYPSNTNFTAPDDNAEVIIPIGRIIVTDGIARFFPETCGPVTIDQCAGVLSVSRGGETTV